MSKPRHSLSRIDADSRRAFCAICGSVKVFRNGNYWVCSVKSRQANDSWRERHPAQVNASRHKISAHHLISRNIDSQSGVCPLDGLVDIVPYGRGYACGVRARQLNISQAAPQTKCWKCGSWTSTDNPQLEGDACTRCNDELRPGRTILGWFDEPRSVERIREAAFLLECEEAGMHVGFPDDPYQLDDHQPVAGWKTIGSPLPAR